MKTLSRNTFKKPKYTNRVLQFGEGNFLRAFVDWQIDLLNEQTQLDAGIVIVRPIDTDFPPLLNEQDGLYTSVIRGIDDHGNQVEKMRIICSVNHEISIYQDFESYLSLAKDPNINFIFSNTTEAGIAFDEKDKMEDKPANTFPGKLTQWLFNRYTYFDGASDKGLFIIPCELIDYNGSKLKEIINHYIDLWGLGFDFKKWVNESNSFCSTLVDRIVTGHPREELSALEEKVGYHDQFMVTAEYFYLFVIQGPKTLSKALNLEQSQLNIKIVDDIKPYKDLKVGILNGAHTAMVPLAYLSGINTVGEAMEDVTISQFVQTMLKMEIIPSLSLPEDTLKKYAESVIQRFRNPYIKHQLTSIALNSMTKWRTRLLPQFITYTEKNGHIPTLITLSLAAQILYYRGFRGEEKIPLSDDEKWIDFFSFQWEEYEKSNITLSNLVTDVLKDVDHWGLDLNSFPNLTSHVVKSLNAMLTEGVYDVLKRELKGL
ncbi:tagaturonate reductase [Grimontia hollisae]|uniref:tagaturonate reductase n=1 Tax=Grimontia hollisae TaxID=673 RepID=UPI0023D986DE|nr:tagaturonate reductase [Grimontia hollisae]MDF2183986.1 tagaturonate reductase [Grimontia hollisae]